MELEHHDKVDDTPTDAAEPEKAVASPPIVRTITGFVTLSCDDFHPDQDCPIHTKMRQICDHLEALKKKFVDESYTVQTIRIATNPFPEWLPVTRDDGYTNYSSQRQLVSLADDPKLKKVIQHRLKLLDSILVNHGTVVCAVGPGDSKIPCHADICRLIVETSSKLSCTLNVDATDHDAASAAAETIYNLSTIGDDQLGLSNFQFAVSSSTCPPRIPFFPVAFNERLFDRDPTSSCMLLPDLPRGEATYTYQFAIGLENGHFVKQALKECAKINRIDTNFRKNMTDAILPIQNIAKQYTADSHDKITFCGIDTSLNPGLDPEGSIAAAMEQLEEVSIFGQPGTIAAAAQLTKTIQSLQGIETTGYCGLMLPVCEDQRLADLSRRRRHLRLNGTDNTSGREALLSVQHLLNISSVCGVGIDTVPIAGAPSAENKQRLASLILDVVGLAERWNKPLTCRVFPVPNCDVGQSTNFQDFPHMVDAEVFDLCE
jgi:hypothetical protein